MQQRMLDFTKPSIPNTVQESEDQAFIGGRRADILADGNRIGVFGEIHPAVLNAFELEHSVAAFEFDLMSPHRDTPADEILFYIADSKLAVMKNACGEACIRFSPGKTIIEMVEGSYAPAAITGSPAASELPK